VTQSIKNLLGKTPEFRAILDKSAHLLALQRHFLAVSPDYLAQGCQISGLQFGVLSIIARNATIAAKLRQLAPSLAEKLRSRGCEVSGIHVKVQVSYAANVVKAPPRVLTPPAKQAFETLNSTLPDSPLKSAVEKILHINKR
jgi:hypothetical protein